jgi:hypothetical protein
MSSAHPSSRLVRAAALGLAAGEGKWRIGFFGQLRALYDRQCSVRPSKLLIPSLLAGFLSLAGCKQGLGDRCQLRSDCAAGLACLLPVGGNCIVGGSCQPENQQDRLCGSSSDCAAGLSCLVSSSCTDNGARVCMAAPDLAAVSFDLGAKSD